MPKPIHKTSRSHEEAFQGRHRYEHWRIDNQVYFTARCRDQYPAFTGNDAKAVFWDRFEYYTNQFHFVPWVTSLLDNHYHTLGYLYEGQNLPLFIQRLHGSVAKLVNDLLPQRRLEFWRDAKGHEYFDGAIRDEKQGRLAFRYTLFQAVRHGIVKDWREYPHTRVNVELETAIRRSRELNAFLEGVPYKRYQNKSPR
jgi:REP element-mobilizing transposase RayT